MRDYYLSNDININMMSGFNRESQGLIIFFLLFILLGIWELGIGIEQSLNVIFNGFPYQTICGTFDNPGPYSIFIVIILPIAWFYVLQIRTLFSRNFFGKLIILLSVVYVILSFIILPCSMSRTSWIAASIGCGIITYYNVKGGIKPKIMKRIIVLLISLLVLSISLLYGLKRDSVDGRILIWKISCSLMKEHFISGVGGGHYAGKYGIAQEQYFLKNSGTEHEKYVAGAPEFAYNEYIQIVVEYGLVGLLMIIFIIGYSLYHLLHADTKDRIPIIGAFVCLLVVSLFSYPFRNFHTCLLAVCVIVLALFLPNRTRSKKKKILRYGFLFLILSILSYKVCISFSFLGNSQIAYRQWSLLKPYFDTEHFDKIAFNYAVLYPYLRQDAAFLFEYGQCLSKIEHYEESNRVLKEGLLYSSDPMFLNILGKNYYQLGKYRLAEDMFHQAYYRIPHRIYPLYLLMNLYKEEDRKQEVLSIAYRIVNQKEKKESLETKFMKNEAKKELMNGFN